MNRTMVVAGLSGFASALLVDLHAFNSSDGGFNWGKAVARWIAGGLSGVLLAAGAGVMA